MVTAFFLTTRVLLALAVAANPVVAEVVTVPLIKRFGTSNSNFAQDQRRAKAFRAKFHRTPHLGINSPAENFQSTSYLATVGVGNPATNYSLIIDTGSSNTWVGANQSYVKTNTSFPTPYDVSVTYGSGNFSGTEFIDQITIAPGLVIPSQSIGVANVGFKAVDGILGIGPTILTGRTLSPPINSSILIPTVTDTLFALNTISEEVIGIFFAPITNSSEELNGELTWGGVDHTKITSNITYVPITETFPSNQFWGLNMSTSYGDIPLLNNTAGFLDTGTTHVLLATDAFKLYQNLTGAVLDPSSGFLTITPSQYNNLKSLNFHLTGTQSVFEFTPNAQIVPRQLNGLINTNATADTIFLVVADSGTESGAGLDFTLGQTGLERFYSVYDTGNRRVGLATTNFTNATTN